MTDITRGTDEQAPITTIGNAGPDDTHLSQTDPRPESITPFQTNPEAPQGVARKVKERLTNTADTQKAGFADRLDEFADSLNRSSEQFAGKQDWIAGAIARGGSELGTLASSLRNADVGDLLRHVQTFAVRRPGLFIGGSLAAGFAVARFGKIVAADISRSDLPTIPEIGHAEH